MFNSPVLDMTIGLVLIFLLYSLLVTTINEGIATLLSLRARMLRNAISDHMLANASTDTRWQSIRKGFVEFFREILVIVIGRRKELKTKIGHHFFDHPLMKNYGSTRIYPLPSYIPSENFSTVLIDLLRKEFDQKLPQIIQDKLNTPNNYDTEETWRENLSLSSDLVRIKEVLDYYGRQYANNKSGPENSAIDEDTWRILQLHLRESGYNWEKFIAKTESWFDDTMKRVSGWYKRQTQTILFFLGLLIACILNVDTIQLANRLAKDKDAREKMTQLAIQAIDTYKDDPRIKKNNSTNQTNAPDSSSTITEEMAFNDYQRKLDSLVRQGQSELEEANNLLALGWKKKSGEENQSLTYYDGASKAIGFLLTALAICLGAPFWFDLLNKLVKIRGTGVKENGDIITPSKATSAVAVAPVIIRTNAGEEAIG